MLTVYTVCAVLGGFVALRGALRILDLPGKRDLFVVSSPQAVTRHPEQLHVGGVAAEGDVRSLHLEAGDLARVSRSYVSVNLLVVAAASFGCGGVLATLLKLPANWTLPMALICGIAGLAVGAYLRALRRKWD